MNQENKQIAHQNVVRFITAGSVDDGKSTLIGRLLYDTKSILVDQLESLAKTKHARVTSSDAGVDLALLTDGLEAEREQGITIDVAYRYFSTPKRKFIVADAPGHEQYTRNLVTGASQSDVAVILVDATRVNLSNNPAILLAQTKRHAAIVHLLGLRHVVFAINKMDLFDFDEEIFNTIKQSIEELTQKIGLPKPTLIPISALLGVNVASASKHTPWYQGPTLLQWLEALDTSPPSANLGLRLPIQYIARQDGSASDDFRGYLGQIESGSITKGQKIIVLPSNQEATVEEIFLGNHSTGNQNNSVQFAQTGDAVAIQLSEDIDISRGSIFIDSQDKNPPTSHKQVIADLCWLDAEPLSQSRKYALRHTTNTVTAKIKDIQRVLDIETLAHESDIHALNANEIGRVELLLQKPITSDNFEHSQHLGSFILIDEATNHTVAAGMIR